MREESVARRYAVALFYQALQTKTLEAVHRDLGTVARADDKVPELHVLLNQPLITEANKKAALNAGFGSTIGKPTLLFLNLLIDKRRIGLLPEIYAEFDRRVREHSNIALAEAISAVPLTPAEQKSLQASLEKRTGKKIELKTDVDPSLIGGVMVRIGDTVMDGTVKSQLERLREHLLARK
jgi:F-type H+-transporting ATPase subunit delta